MKILTKEEEEAHYSATLKGGATGGFAGLVVGGAVLFAANARFHTIRNLTLPMKAFLVTSSTTFAAITSADRASRNFEIARDPSRRYKDKASTELEAAQANESTLQRLKEWGRENRYPIVGVSWVASMGIALAMVGRNPYLSGAQKLVQARVYAQGLTLAVLIATAAFEVGDASGGKGRWETIKVLDPNDPEHKHLIEKRIHHEAYQGEDLWRDMVEAEERKIANRKKAAKGQAEEHASAESKPSSNNKSKSENTSSPSKPDDNDKSSTPNPKPDPKDKGKANKDRIAAEDKAAGNVDYKEAEAREARNQADQKQKRADIKEHASAGGPKISDRGES